MNSSLVFLLLVVIAGLAECKPKGQLSARVLAKVAEYKDKRGGGKQTDWPYGWIEYASLVGKCEAALNWLELLEMDVPEEDEGGILSAACPKALEVGEDLLEADDAMLKKATDFFREIFGLLQCVNLQAEREELQIVLELNGKDAAEDVFLREAEPLFDTCEDVFDSVEEEEEEFEKDLQQFKNKDGSKRGADIHSLLREILKANRR